MHLKTSLVTTLAAAAASLLLSLSPVQAKIECDTSLGTYYPFCINIPDNAPKGQKFPTIVFLAGSGARGPPSRVRELSGFDGDGKLVYQYYAGNRGAAQTMAATKFVVVTPILPMHANGQEQRHYFPEHLDKLYAHLRNKGYPIDWDRLHLGGFSMGGRGVCRNGVARPELYASLSPAAGPCEAPGSGTLSQQRANSVLDKVSAIKTIPIRQYAGKWDNTVGQSSPKKMQDELKKCGASHAELVWVDGNHNDMSTKPFNVDRLEWMLRQKRGGGGGAPPSYDPQDDKKEDDSKKEENGKKHEGGKHDEGKPDRIKVNLSPLTDGKASTDIKQFNSDVTVEKKEEKDSSSPSSGSESLSVDSPIPASSASSTPKKCKATRRQRKKRAAAKRSLVGEEIGYAHPGPVRRGVLPKSDSEHDEARKTKRGLTLADIISNAKAVVATNGTQPKEGLAKRTPLESLKAHAGNRRSHSGSSSSHGDKLGRRASR